MQGATLESSKLIPEYLVLLLTSGTHHKPVPHLAAPTVYKQLLDPSWKPREVRKRPRHHFAEGDDWDLPDFEPKKTARRKVQRRVWSRSPDTSEQSSNESHASRTKAEHCSSPSSSSSSSSSGSSSSSCDPRKSCNAGNVEGQVHHRRNNQQRTYFGKSWFIPRIRKGNKVAMVMRCMNPLHNPPGRKCTKEIALSKVMAHGFQGDAAMSGLKRCLKAWVLFGCGLESTDAHMDPSWTELLVQLLQDGSIANDEALDKTASLGWSDDICVPLAQPEPRAVEPTRSQAHLLGECGPVPAGIHERMEELAARGSIPITTLPQRLRSMPTAGSRYRVPSDLVEARNHGYIGPNLPAPAGLRWVASGGIWRLCLKGG